MPVARAERAKRRNAKMRNQSEPSNFAATKTPISQEALDQLFYEARTHSAWLPEPVPVEFLRKAYELARLGPTSANGSPARFVFLTTPGAKALLKPVLAPGNVDKTMAAPVTVIIAWDTEFHEQLPKLFPHADVRSYFIGNRPLIEENAFRNSSLQAAYFIMAARALGLDCGPMSGFDAGKLNAAFLPDGKWKVNLLCNLGYGDANKLHPRDPRLNFEEASVVL
jgi:3-hydroxypropanoate dehydrogenase